MWNLWCTKPRQMYSDHWWTSFLIVQWVFYCIIKGLFYEKWCCVVSWILSHMPSLYSNQSVNLCYIAFKEYLYNTSAAFPCWQECTFPSPLLKKGTFSKGIVLEMLYQTLKSNNLSCTWSQNWPYDKQNSRRWINRTSAWESFDCWVAKPLYQRD